MIDLIANLGAFFLIIVLPGFMSSSQSPILFWPFCLPNKRSEQLFQLLEMILDGF